MKNKKFYFAFILIIFFFITNLYSCIIPVNKLNEKKSYYNNKVVRIKAEVSKIFYFKDSRYYLYEIDDNGSKAFLLSIKKLKRHENIDFNGKILYITRNFNTDFENELKSKIESYLIKMTTINEKTIFLHSLKIIDIIKKISKENNGIVLIFAYNFN